MKNKNENKVKVHGGVVRSKAPQFFEEVSDFKSGIDARKLFFVDLKELYFYLQKNGLYFFEISKDHRLIGDIDNVLYNVKSGRGIYKFFLKKWIEVKRFIEIYNFSKEKGYKFEPYFCDGRNFYLDKLQNKEQVNEFLEKFSVKVYDLFNPREEKDYFSIAFN